MPGYETSQAVSLAEPIGSALAFAHGFTDRLADPGSDEHPEPERITHGRAGSHRLPL